MTREWLTLRDGETGRSLASAIARESTRPLKMMEVCGSHSHAIARYGIRSLLPSTVSLVPGPGCPVCVAPQSDIDLALDLADLPDVTLTTFGDLVRVPGAVGTLAEKRAEGADVRIVHSPMDALELAKTSPERQVVFVAIGFETTAPGVASTVKVADEERVGNFTLLVAHKTMPRAMRALVESGESGVQAFLCPGHVSAITGSSIYEFLPAELGAPCAVAGFEPLDVLLAVRAVVRMWEAGEPAVEIVYRRAVRPEGNPRARAILDEVFEPCDSEWRGLGTIPGSGLRLRERYGRFDAETRFGIPRRPSTPHPACRCGEILRGALTPRECAAFGNACTPEHPLGPCMVSSEGACAAEWQYRV